MLTNYYRLIWVCYSKFLSSALCWLSLCCSPPVFPSYDPPSSSYFNLYSRQQLQRRSSSSTFTWKRHPAYSLRYSTFFLKSTTKSSSSDKTMKFSRLQVMLIFRSFPPASYAAISYTNSILLWTLRCIAAIWSRASAYFSTDIPSRNDIGLLQFTVLPFALTVL